MPVSRMTTNATGSIKSMVLPEKPENSSTHVCGGPPCFPNRTPPPPKMHQDGHDHIHNLSRTPVLSDPQPHLNCVFSVHMPRTEISQLRGFCKGWCGLGLDGSCTVCFFWVLPSILSFSKSRGRNKHIARKFFNTKVHRCRSRFQQRPME